MARLYIVLDIGCLECGLDTHVVSIYETEEEAKESADRYEEKKGAEYFTDGDRSLEVHSYTGSN